MELTPRKRAILAAIVKYHIATGAPVGSKWLTTTLENAPSSATLRNEMSELDRMGLLEQPHTSAGRIPTGKGYEFYVSNLMQRGEITDNEKAFIDSCLEQCSVDTENIQQSAAKILSRLTGLPAFAAKIAEESAIIKKVQITILSNRLIMLVVITDDGRTKSKLIRSAAALSSDMLLTLEKIAKEKIEGKSFKELTFAAMQNIYAAYCTDVLAIMPIIANLFDIINEMAQSEIEFAGENNIYSMLNESDRAGKLLLFLEKKDGIMSVIGGNLDRVGVIFGADTGFNELDRVGVIVAPYGPPSSPIGRIGVIGPTRMSYGQIVPSIAYLATKLSEVLNESIKDLEEI